MAKVTGNICAPVGKYVKDGEEKTRWMKVGIVLETDKGLRIKLDAVPIGGQEQGLWLSVFPPDEQQQRPAQSRPQQSSGAPDNDIPF
jgi:hypothetical protein